MERLQVPKQMELALLIDIVLEASRWSSDSDKDSIRLEVEDRLSHLLPADNYDGVQVHGTMEIEVDPEMLKEKNKHARYAETHVRVTGADGKKHWYRKEDCVQVPVTTGGSGFRWELKKEVQDV